MKRSLDNGWVVDPVYSVDEVAPGSVGELAPVPNVSVYSIRCNAAQGGVCAVTEINSGVGWFSPISSGLSFEFRSGSVPLVEESFNTAFSET